jgi:hypothetical protein
MDSNGIEGKTTVREVVIIILVVAAILFLVWYAEASGYRTGDRHVTQTSST